MCKSKIGIRIGNKIKKIDSCLINLVQVINKNTIFKTLSCCCGHDIYHPTIFITLKKNNGKNRIVYEFFSKLNIIPEKKRYWNYYKKDRETDLYYNPKVEGFYDNS